jgi:site-specific DNA-methyltransferase (adenine-specific)
MVCGIEDAGFEIRDVIMWVFSSGFPKSHNLHEEWEGWGTALKPAYEPILIARKPLNNTVAENMRQFGTGAINIDASRIPGQWKFGTQTDIRGGNFNNARPSDGNVFAKNVESNPLGRWPANLIHDGSDEVLKLFPNSKGQQGNVTGKETSHTGDENTHTYGEYARVPFEKRNDTGSAARFFYCPKTSRKDRNEGCDHLPDVKGGMVSNTSGQHMTRREEDYKPEPVKNNHPTVKPTALMQYLCRLVTQPGGTIVDPFMGSGSTGKAAMYEGFNFIGIDIDPNNKPIAEARIKFAIEDAEKEQEEKEKQLDLFKTI